MTTESSLGNNKRIAKNTFFLYFRQLLTMGVALYTVRVILATLGVVDYGIYNVIGGVVAMLSVLSGTMSSASQRFFAYELGQKNYDRLQKMFSATLMVYGLIALIILVVAETAGLWFLNTQLTIPPDRMAAAQWVYQFSVLVFMSNMITVPYNAVIIAHEKMKVYAYVSIMEVVLKLVIVFLLSLIPFDKLKLYAILVFVVSGIIRYTYRTYCKRNFEECRFSFHWDKPLLKELMSYSGWNLFGTLSSMGRDHGLNILLNIFFGPALNAARGVAYQAQVMLLNLGQNFFTAVRPQITKSFAANKREETMQLVFQSSKFSFYLLFLITFPLVIETNFFLNIWLKDVPQYAVIFVQLILVDTIFRLIVNPLVTLAQASGNIKWYQIIVGGTGILTLPVGYVVLYFGGDPQYVFCVSIINTIICNSLRMVILKRLVDFDVKGYARKVSLNIVLVAGCSAIVPLAVKWVWTGDSILKSLTVVVLAGISTLASILLIGLQGEERKFVYDMVGKKLKLKGAVGKEAA